MWGMSADDRYAALERDLGYTFADRGLLQRALRHGSADEARAGGSYQRLEFLGDAVLGHATALLLFERFPGADEGMLTRMRSHLIRSTSLAEKAAWLGLDGWVEVGRSEEQSRGRERSALLEDVFEALVGAIALDGGFEAARAFVEAQLGDEVRSLDERTLMLADAKSALQQEAQARGLALPEYLPERSKGPDHKPMWVYAVTWKGEEIARGEGRTKRDAQQQAARRALARLGVLPEPGSLR
jgi:ribonuclease-3